MLLYFEPTIMAKGKCNALSSLNVDIWTTDAVRDWFFCYSVTLIWGERGQ